MKVESLFVPAGQDRIHVEVRTPEKRRGTLVLVHGFLSEGREFHPAPDMLAERGWAVAVVDLRGHGRSSGPRGFASARVAVEDLRATLAALRARGDPGPMGIVGHSAGTALVLKFLAEADDVKAAAIVAPLSTLLAQVDFAERAGYRAAIRVNRTVQRLGLPSLKIPYKYATRGGYRKLFDDPAAADRAHRAGFLQSKADLAFAQDMLDIDGVAFARQVRHPVLAVICTNDRILRNSESRKVVDALAGPKRVVEIPTCHSCFGDAEVGAVVDALDGWFTERTA